MSVLALTAALVAAVSGIGAACSRGTMHDICMGVFAVSVVTLYLS